MNYKIKALTQINKLIFESAFENPTFGDIDITDGEVRISTNGIIRSLIITFRGRLHIYNKLPDGYSIRITNNKIFIHNLLGKKLRQEGLLFNFIGEFDIKMAEVTSFTNNKFLCNINDINKLQFINYSKTNVEDDTLLFLEEAKVENIIYSLETNKIDDNSIKGLYTEKSFANGYSGYYNYHPDEGVYMTGKQLTNESSPILNPKLPLSNPKIQQKIKKISTKYAGLLKERNLEKTQTSKRVEKIKPVIKGEKVIGSPTPQELKEPEKEVKKGGKY